MVEQWWLKDELLARARQPYDKATVDSVPPKQIPPSRSGRRRTPTMRPPNEGTGTSSELHAGG